MLPSTMRFDTKILIQIQQTKVEPWFSIFVFGQNLTFAKNNIFTNVKIEPFFGKQMWSMVHQLDSFLFSLKFKKYYRKIVFFEYLYKKFFVPHFIFDFKNKLFSHGTDGIEIQMPDLMLMGPYKTVSALKAALNHDFQYLVTINASTYINVPLLVKAIKKIPNANTLGGRFIDKNLDLVSGSFRILSRDLVEHLVHSKKIWQMHLPEDVALSRALSGMELRKHPLPIFDLPDVISVHKLSDSQLNTVVAYRCKSGNNSNRNDAEIMLALHTRLLRG
jgi:hypothetical protein